MIKRAEDLSEDEINKIMEDRVKWKMLSSLISITQPQGQLNDTHNGRLQDLVGDEADSR